MFELESVTKTYRGRREPVHALHEISLNIDRGGFLTVTGPSGSGKSTLLLTIGGLIQPTAGRVVFHGTDLYSLPASGLASYRNRKIGFVLQSFNLIPYLSACENVMVPMSLGNGANGNHEERARALLDRLGLADRMDHLPRELSVGQQQRVAIARALATDPEVILADEPTGNLDTRRGQEVLALFQELNRDGITIVLVTHEEQLAQHAGRIVRLMDGRLASNRPIAQPLDARAVLAQMLAESEDEI